MEIIATIITVVSVAITCIVIIVVSKAQRWGENILKSRMGWINEFKEETSIVISFFKTNNKSNNSSTTIFDAEKARYKLFNIIKKQVKLIDIKTKK